MIIGRDLCGDFTSASRLEWLVTNGLGGYACGTVAGANTRRYHAFLMASLAPPVERTMVVAKVDVSVEYAGRMYHLSPNEFVGGTVDPRGFVLIESFELRDGIPIWHYALGDALLEQRILMVPGRNVSYLSLELVRASSSARIALKPLTGYRDMHTQGRGAQPFSVEAQSASCVVHAFPAAWPLFLMLETGRFAALNEWYWNFLHREELARGLDAVEDLFVPGIFSAELAAGATLTFSASLEKPSAASSPTPQPLPSPQALFDEQRAHAARFKAVLPKSAPDWIETLAIASEQFLVRRGDSVSIIAGYPWFADWGRDTMIALPGLATILKRYDVAAGILRAWAKFVDRGMLPNHFPDQGETPEYNTADATLWMFNAVHDYLSANRDPELTRDIYPTLVSIIHAHVEGTRYGIRVDPADGLLAAGERGVQLTWMDAKRGDHVFTPRMGKPVEINALWLNALEVTARLAGRMRDGAQKQSCEALLATAAAGFARFWNPEGSYLYDVIDVEGGKGVDAMVRPNQIIAVSLPYCTLGQTQVRAVVERCGRDLLTSYGLRSLAPDDAAYVGRYAGDQWQRDAAYHQGTVWSWLLGPFARAHFRAYSDAALAQSFLAPVAQHLASACIGSVSEVFDGDAPHIAGGCFAQAWSVAEILRAWVQLERIRHP
jgi:predicted glycogen debranching enzyme